VLLRPNEADAPNLFGRDGPLVLEAGFGDGSFLVHLARKNPTWNLLGADISRGSVSRAYRRLQRTDVSHARLFLGKAEFLVRNVIAEGELHRLYVNFPDPWPKQRHRHRRLLKTPFLALLSTRLVANGTVLFTTDDRTYFEYVISEATHTGLYDIAMPPPPPAVRRTKYAKKWAIQKRPLFHLRLTCIDRSPADFPPIITRTTVHHAILAGSLPHPDSFESFVHQFSGGCVVVAGVLRRVGIEALLFEVRIKEEDLTQEVLIEARCTRTNVVVSISTFGQPLPTRGTQEAIGAITDWLVRQGMTQAESYY